MRQRVRIDHVGESGNRTFWFSKPEIPSRNSVRFRALLFNIPYRIFTSNGHWARIERAKSLLEHDLEQYRDQLRRVIHYRLDPRVLRRLDASDVVQEVMAEASRYVETWRQNAAPSTFACLYQLARAHISRIHRDHVTTEKRSVRLEEAEMGLGDESVFVLAKRLIHVDPTPSRAAVQKETREKVRAALTEMKESDREVLVMRILEGIPARDVSQVLGISVAAVNMRQLRALERLRSKLTHLEGLSGS